MSELREAAVAYAERGWRVFRIRPGAKIPQDRWQHGGEDERATTELDSVRMRWTAAPNANIGIATGNGLAVLDIDTHHGGARPEWAPETLTARTPNGGYHLYYHVDREVRNSAGKLATGVDVRGDGGMVVAPPSRITHLAGGLREYVGVYAWLNPNTPIASIDASLLIPPRETKTEKKLARASFGEGERHEAMLTLAGKMRSWGCEYPEIMAALNALNLSRFEPVLDLEWVKKVAKSAAKWDINSDLLS